MTREGFEEIDHTADVGLRVRAASLEGLFRQAALGLAALLTDPAALEAREGIRVEVRGIDLEELMVGWLNELLYRFETERRIAVAFPELSIEREGEGYRLRAAASTGRWDPARHPAGAAVKAATYHGLQIAASPDDGGYAVTLVFDV
jgi:SHS2 domain-containing protein